MTFKIAEKIVNKTHVPFEMRGKFLFYDGSYYDHKKILAKLKEWDDRAISTIIPENREDRYYYLREFGPMC